MGNKLKRNKPNHDVNDNIFISKQCFNCERNGEILIRQRVDNGKVQLTDKYYLCKPCFLKLLTPICSECESRESEYQLNRDIDSLEIVCSNCGLVISSITNIEDHKEKRDYTINRPYDYNALDPDECIRYI